MPTITSYTTKRDLTARGQTAVSWHARWRSGGPSRLPTIPDGKLPAIERALLKGAEAHGFDSDAWTSARVAVVIQRITGMQPGRKAVHRLLREWLGWCLQPATSDVTVVPAAAQPLPTPASTTDSLAEVAAAALADLEDLPVGRPGLARSKRPASPTERREAIAHAWRDEPGITDIALAERFGVSRRTIQRDTQALQERGIQRRGADRRRRSQRTRAQYDAIYRRFLAWPAPHPAGSQRRRPRPLDCPAGNRRWSRRRGTIAGVTAAGMQPPAPTCPPRRLARAGRQPVRLPAADTPTGDHLTRPVRAAAP